MLQPRQPKPLYLQIQDDIRQSIRLKEYKASDQVPNEDQLCVKYGVSRVTVRRAIQGLVDAGILEKHHGKGTFVAVPKSTIKVDYHGGFSSQIEGEEHLPLRRILDKACLPADAKQAAMLNINLGDWIIYVKRLMIEDDLPIAIDELCVSERQFPEIINLLEDNVSFYGLLEEQYHIKFGESEYTLDVSTAKSDEACMLLCATGDPMFILYKRLFDAAGRPIHYSKSILRGDRITYCFKTGSKNEMLSFRSLSSPAKEERNL